jgi:peptidoglycan/LPS O-acetylase OafA/YrhL
MSQKPHLGEIDLVRGLAILGVLLVHSTAWATVYMAESKYYGVYNFFNIFFKFGTTTFIFLSSFVLFYNYYPQKLTWQRTVRFYRNRLLYILLPYVVFSVFYFVYKWDLEGRAWHFPAMLQDFGMKLLTGDAFYHLYFVFISVQFYILFPFLLMLMQRFRKLAAHAIWIGLAVAWGFIVLNHYEWHVPNRGSWAPTYFAQFFLGAWLGIYFDKVRAWLKPQERKTARLRAAVPILLHVVWIAAGFVQVYMWHSMRSGSARYSALLLDAVWILYTCLTALVLMHFALRLRHRNSIVPACLTSLGKLSFGIYLLHPFILNRYERFPILKSGQAWIHHLWYAGGFIFTLFVTWALVYAAYRWLPLSWIAFGRNPLKNRKDKKSLKQKETPVKPAAPAG